MRILKLPLLYEFEKELTKIFKVKDKAQKSEKILLLFSREATLGLALSIRLFGILVQKRLKSSVIKHQNQASNSSIKIKHQNQASKSSVKI